VPPSHPNEPHQADLHARLNWLRAGVLGANDGIVSTAGLVVGVAGATSQRAPILTAGLAGLVAGAVSMALGEYVSVSSQRDTERTLLAQERRELAEHPDAELQELAELYLEKGLSAATARTVAEELSAKDAFTAHADVELGINPKALTSPWQAAISSAISFTLGALLPVLAIVLTGGVSATIGGSDRRRAVRRIVLGGALAMIVTYGIGRLLGTAV
jgi:VIT1/CCC1 family predicted Fe2+/Mn2+ transporter